MRSSAVSHDLRLEHKFAKTIKGELGKHFITQDPSEDRTAGTDFCIWGLTPFRVAVRLRTYRFFLSFPSQFTLRWSRPSNVETEIHKVRRGLVDYLFYGFVDEQEAHIVQYFIGDLSIFRRLKPAPRNVYNNDPPDSQLAVWDLKQLPSDFILKIWRAT